MYVCVLDIGAVQDRVVKPADSPLQDMYDGIVIVPEFDVVYVL